MQLEPAAGFGHPRAVPHPNRTLCRLLAVVLGLLAILPAARAQEFTPGQITEQVVTRADARQSYAVYLPTAFERGHDWPVIFVFDPGARGRNAVERLRAAAETFGYVVAGSNNSRNGPIEPQYAAMVAMIGDLAQRVPLDPKRVYTAGMSGGSRVALMTALISGKIRGVLAFSAGLPGGMGLPDKVPFALYGTAGRTDMNYAEMKRLEADLEARGATHRLAIFDGGHTWPPSGTILAGVEWLELEAMRGSLRPRDEALVGRLLEARVAAIPAAPAPERWQALQAIARDFQGLAEVAVYEKEAKALGASAEVKAWLKADRKQLDREIGLLTRLDEAAMAGDADAIRKPAAELRKLLAAPSGSDDQLLARRIQTVFASSMRENIRSALQQEAYEDAENLLVAMTAYEPSDARFHYDLARARGYRDDRKGALAALTDAMKAGYTNATQAAAEPAFAKFKDDAAFKTLLAKMGRPAGAVR